MSTYVGWEGERGGFLSEDGVLDVVVDIRFEWCFTFLVRELEESDRLCVRAVAYFDFEGL